MANGFPDVYDDPEKQQIYEQEMARLSGKTIAPIQQAPEITPATDVQDDSISYSKALAQGALEGFGQVVQGGKDLYNAAARGLGAGNEYLIDNGNPVNNVDQALRDLGWLQQTEAAKKRIEQGGNVFAEGKGNVFDPSNLELNKNIDLGAVGYNLLRSTGQLAPTVATSIINPALGAATGSLQTGTTTADDVSQQFIDAYRKGGKEQESVISSPAYQAAVAKGLSGDDALRDAVSSIRTGAFVASAPSGAIEALVGGKFLKGVAGKAGSASAGRVAGDLALGAVGEGAQEVSEKLLGQAGGTYLGGGGNAIELGQGTAEDFVAGALMGGALHAGTHTVSSVANQVAGVDREIAAKEIDAPGGMGGKINLSTAEDISVSAESGGALSSAIMHGSEVESAKARSEYEVGQDVERMKAEEQRFNPFDGPAISDAVQQPKPFNYESTGNVVSEMAKFHSQDIPFQKISEDKAARAPAEKSSVAKFTYLGIPAFFNDGKVYMKNDSPEAYASGLSQSVMRAAQNEKGSNDARLSNGLALLKESTGSVIAKAMIDDKAAPPSIKKIVNAFRTNAITRNDVDAYIVSETMSNKKVREYVSSIDAAQYNPDMVLSSGLAKSTGMNESSGSALKMMVDGYSKVSHFVEERSAASKGTVPVADAYKYNEAAAARPISVQDIPSEDATVLGQDVQTETTGSSVEQTVTQDNQNAVGTAMAENASETTSPSVESEKPMTRNAARGVSEANAKQALMDVASSLGVSAVVGSMARVGRHSAFEGEGGKKVFGVFERRNGVESVVINAEAFDGMSPETMQRKMAETLIHELTHGHFDKIYKSRGVTSPGALTLMLKREFGKPFIDAYDTVTKSSAYANADKMEILDEALAHMVEGVDLRDMSVEKSMKKVGGSLLEKAKNMLVSTLQTIEKKTKYESVRALARGIISALGKGHYDDNIKRLAREILDGMAIKAGVGARDATELVATTKRPTLKSMEHFDEIALRTENLFVAKTLMIDRTYDPMSDGFGKDGILPPAIAQNVKIVSDMLRASGASKLAERFDEDARYYNSVSPSKRTMAQRIETMNAAFMTAALKKNDEAFNALLEMGLSPFGEVGTKNAIPFVVAVKNGLPSVAKAASVAAYTSNVFRNNKALVDQLLDLGAKSKEVFTEIAKATDANGLSEVLGTTPGAETVQLAEKNEAVADAVKLVNERIEGSTGDLTPSDVSRLSAKEASPGAISSALKSLARADSVSAFQTAMNRAGKAMLVQNHALEMTEEGIVYKKAARYMANIKKRIAEIGLDGEAAIAEAERGKGKKLTKKEKQDAVSFINFTINGHNVDYEESNQSFKARIEALLAKNSPENMKEIGRIYKKDISPENLSERQKKINEYNALSDHQKNYIRVVREQNAKMLRLDTASSYAAMISKMQYDAKSTSGVRQADKTVSDLIEMASKGSSIDDMHSYAQSVLFDTYTASMASRYLGSIKSKEDAIDSIMGSIESLSASRSQKDAVASRFKEYINKLEETKSRKGILNVDENHIYKDGFADLGIDLKNNESNIEAYKSMQKNIDAIIRMNESIDIGKSVFNVVKDGDARSAVVKDSFKSIDDLVKVLGERDEDLLNITRGMRDGKLRVEELIKTGYVPHKRFGDFTVTFRDSNNEVKMFARFDTKAAAERGAEEFIKTGMINGYTSDIEASSASERSSWTHNIGTVSPTMSGMFAGILDPNMIDSLAEKVASKGHVESDIAQALRMISAQMSVANSSMKNELKRKGTIGESSDIDRVYASTAMQMSDTISSRLGAFRMQKALIEAEKNRESDVDGNVEYMARTYKYITNPIEEYSGARGLMFLTKIGFSMMSSLFNLTSIINGAASWHADLTRSPGDSILSSGKAAKAAFEFVRKNYGLSSFVTGGRARTHAEFDYSMFDAATQKIIRDQIESGQASGSESYNMRKVASGSFMSKDSRIAKGLSKAVDLSSSMFGFTENINRVATVAMAVDAFMKMSKKTVDGVEMVTVSKNARGVKGGRKIDMSLDEFVDDFVATTQGDYEKTGRSEMERGLGAAIMQFKHFKLNLISQLLTMGNIGRVFMLASLFLLGGTGAAASAVMWDEVSAMINVVSHSGLFGERGKLVDMDSATADLLDSTVGDGVIGKMIKFGFLGLFVDTKRMQGGLLSDAIKSIDPNLKAEERGRTLASALGPTASSIYGAVTKDGVDKAGITMLSNMMKSYDILKTGYIRDSSGNVIVEAENKYTSGIIKALGSNSVAIRDERRKSDILKAKEGNIKVVREDFSKRYIEAKFMDDTDEMQKIRDEISDFEEKSGTRLGLNYPSMNRSAMNKKKDLKARTLKSVQKVRRGEAGEYLNGE